MGLSSSVHDVRTLIQSFHPVVAIETTEEERVRELLCAVSSEAALAYFEWSATTGLRRLPDGRMIGGTPDPLTLLRHLDGLTIESVFHLKDFTTYLDDPQIVRKFREVAQHFERTRSAIVLSGPSIELPAEVDHKVAHYPLSLPSADELRRVLSTVLGSLRKTHRVDVLLEPEDLDSLIEALGGMTVNQARQAIAYAVLDDGRLGPDDIATIVERKVASIRDGGLLEYFPVEDNEFSLAGFANLKAWLERAAVGFTEQARELNLQAPKGILLAGVQGCGKSLAAKVIAREWKRPLLKLDAGSLYDKYIGESEKNFRRAVKQAEALAPAVLWIDEIEKGIGTASSGEGDGGVSKRLLGFFLTWLQERKSDVFVAATANDVFSLPPELLRKGRFDELFFVDLPTAEERLRIFEIHLSLHKQDPAAIDLDSLIAPSEGFNGAEIEQAVIAALYRALHDSKPLDASILRRELEETVPLSVSRREDIDRLRRTARGRFVPVS